MRSCPGQLNQHNTKVFVSSFHLNGYGTRLYPHTSRTLDYLVQHTKQNQRRELLSGFNINNPDDLK